MRFVGMSKFLLATSMAFIIDAPHIQNVEKFTHEPIKFHVHGPELKQSGTYSASKDLSSDITIFDDVITELEEKKYNGHLNDTVDRTKYYFLDSKNRSIANHGLLVSKKDPILTDLVDKLTKNIQDSPYKGLKGNQAIAQRLLDFVTNKIEYSSDSTLDSDDDSLRSAYRIIHDQAADCSGKTILYASLLAQTNIDFFIVYLPSHVNVAVEGSFPNVNNCYFKTQNKHYFTAETTFPNFRIGITKIENPERFKNISQLQRPGKEPSIYDMKLRKNVKYLRK